MGVFELGPGSNFELHLLTYDVSVAATGSADLTFCDTLGTPPAPVVVVVAGQSVQASVDDGSVALGSGLIRGECNGDGQYDLADPIYLTGALFPQVLPPPMPACQDACDCNDDGSLNVADVVCLLGGLFGSIAPMPPFPACGMDPTADSLNCQVFSGCP